MLPLCDARPVDISDQISLTQFRRRHSLNAGVRVMPGRTTAADTVRKGWDLDMGGDWRAAGTQHKTESTAPMVDDVFPKQPVSGIAFVNVRIRLRIQTIDATHCVNRSAGVS